MAEQKPTGHVGNLTKEEEEKLQEFWAALFKLWGFVASERPEKEQQNGGSVTPSDAGTPDAKKPKRRLGLFSRKSDTANESPSDSLSSSASGLKLSDVEDKYGETKEFLEALKDTSPEDLRLAFWGMVKHDHPDALLLRFLRARKYDVNRALVMLVSAFRWRSQAMHLDDNIMVKGDCFMEEESKSDDPAKQQEATDFSKLLHLGESFIHGTDKSGRPICYIRVRLHRIGAHCESSLERYTVYLIETSRMLLQSPIETAALIFDMTDFSLANMDYAPIKFMIKCFEANYPESLGVILVHKAPWIFSGIWSVIKGWLDPVVAAKVHFTRTTEDLEALVPRSNLLKSLGGDDEYEYKYIEPTEGENDKQKDTASRDELLKTRMEIATAFQDATLSWAGLKSNSTANGESDIKRTRNELADKLRENYWQLDPYIRARSMYDRLGLIPPSKETTELPSSAQLSEKTNGETVPAVAQAVEQPAPVA
ncbi:phosphatidylinositol transfer protein csr1 [Microsporum canis]|uniref:Phosphatidylinositol transfer protein CSR1 n=1 Tax=Arthroderma otae (strain ATCC MYA-4605 / CBS 113480) TaxID=554155 RepID=C5FL18_ARTOC|nr:phosphatidylinositol transfer protein CSR1 [Microsporum canis CBS 113480]EEQ30390.1 phosphatidylinositol transfer protein CSR1 [Microsporum canis CBS 113480]